MTPDSRHEGAPAPELVVLLAEDGTPVGTAAKAEVHTTDTPLHLAFSCFVFDGAGRVLVTRRAVGKKTFPGVWTNAFCGHPGPGEDLAEAVRRRSVQELGTQVAEVTCVLPNFRYRAVDAAGIVENEICPVFTARIAGEVAPNPEETDTWFWAEAADFDASIRATPQVFSPWLVSEWRLLVGAGAVAL